MRLTYHDLNRVSGAGPGSPGEFDGRASGLHGGGLQDTHLYYSGSDKGRQHRARGEHGRRNFTKLGRVSSEAPDVLIAGDTLFMVYHET
jgi:hypothetical protein